MQMRGRPVGQEIKRAKRRERKEKKNAKKERKDGVTDPVQTNADDDTNRRKDRKEKALAGYETSFVDFFLFQALTTTTVRPHLRLFL